MGSQTVSRAHRFIRKTQLSENEYHKNFHKVDTEVISVITSVEADKVTPLMSKIYLRLLNSPKEMWEREGVLRFEATEREGKSIKAWSLLCEHLGVASATANKALIWLHDLGVIGYYAGKNGVGIRIFLNRATSSIGFRAESTAKKILPFSPASFHNARASQNETPFNDSFADKRILSDFYIPNAPKNGANEKHIGEKSTPAPSRPPNSTQTTADVRIIAAKSDPLSSMKMQLSDGDDLSLTLMLAKLKTELEPVLQKAAVAAAASATKQEMERTREWFETKAMPKATRVAMHECFNLFKKHGAIVDKTVCAKSGMDVGRYDARTQIAEPLRPRTESEIRETADICLALLEMQGQSIDVSLSEMSSEAGGWLLPQDAPKVRELAVRLLESKETEVRRHERESTQT